MQLAARFVKQSRVFQCDGGLICKDGEKVLFNWGEGMWFRIVHINYAEALVPMLDREAGKGTIPPALAHRVRRLRCALYVFDELGLTGLKHLHAESGLAERDFERLLRQA